VLASLHGTPLSSVRRIAAALTDLRCAIAEQQGPSHDASETPQHIAADSKRKMVEAWITSCVTGASHPMQIDHCSLAQTAWPRWIGADTVTKSTKACNASVLALIKGKKLAKAAFARCALASGLLPIALPPGVTEALPRAECLGLDLPWLASASHSCVHAPSDAWIEMCKEINRAVRSVACSVLGRSPQIDAGTLHPELFGSYVIASL